MRVVHSWQRRGGDRMKRMKMSLPFLVSLLVFSSILFWPLTPSKAANINAASCSQTDVQSAINAAADGDRVLVPAGSCTWTTTISWSGKDLTLEGNGIGSTIITINGPTPAIESNATASRVTGFEFILTSGDNILYMRGQGFRVDHNKFTNSTGSRKVGVYVAGGTGISHPTGVVDNNDFFNCRVLLLGTLALGGLTANTIWASDALLGNADAQTGVVYVEDNIFTRTISGNTMDTNYAGRYVFRYNTVSASNIEVHSLQGCAMPTPAGNSERASRSWEVYENTFDAPSGFWVAAFIRGATGVMFNNTITGYSNGILIDNRRSFSNAGAPCGQCGNGDLVGHDGDIDPPNNGWWCRDQIGRGKDAFLLTDSANYPAQADDPAYFWNNTLDGSPVSPIVDDALSATHIQEGRDYFDGTAKPGYTPFAYPHPLRSGTVSRPDPPKNLRVVVQ